MHTIDYNPETHKFEALFCHGTSSANIEAIRRHGIVRPNFDQVLDVVLAPAPLLASRRELFRSRLGAEPLGIEARRSENNVIFVGRLANHAAINLFADEGRRVAQHGGEVYAETWRNVSLIAEEEGLGELPRRFPGAEPSIVLFRIPFELNSAENPSPRTEHGFVSGLSRSLFRTFTCTSDPVEVKFIEPLPSAKIEWYGRPEAAISEVAVELVSPLARAMIESAWNEVDQWADIDDSPVK
jgi:hypothetical protein